MSTSDIAGEGRNVELSVAPDGGPMVGELSEGRILRLAPDGRPDRGFGKQGLLSLGPSTFSGNRRGLTFLASSMAVDRAGRLLVFGQQNDPNQSVQLPGGTAEGVISSYAIVSRFDREGVRDRSFGGGKGYIRDDFGLQSPISAETPFVGALRGAVDARNRPVLLAGVTIPAGACAQRSGVEEVPKALVRLTTSGALDPTFGSGGVSPIDGTTSHPQFEVAGNGQMVVGAGPVGSSRADCRNGDVIYRLGPNGERSIKFGTEGVLALPDTRLAALEPSGAVIVGRRRSRALLLKRYSSSGVPEETFGGGGVAKIALPLGPVEVSSVLIENTGEILVVGFSRGKPTKGRAASFLVARLSRNGKPILGSGGHRWVRTDFRLPMELTSAQAALDSRGRLVVAGTTATPNDPNGRFLVARYLAPSR
ncbi:MAG: hypothetical protein JST08_00490 [Actinobacteria bacterium]|nr:hypothetical protein [Actinomycetota bacterium]